MEELWIARDMAGGLHLFNKRPSKGPGAFYTSGVDNTLRIPRHWFEDVTFENSPQLVNVNMR